MGRRVRTLNPAARELLKDIVLLDQAYHTEVMSQALARNEIMGLSDTLSDRLYDELTKEETKDE